MRVNIRVIPRAKPHGVEQLADGSLTVRVAEPADGGRANAAAVALVAEHFHVPKRAVRIVRGMTSRRKVVEIA